MRSPSDYDLLNAARGGDLGGIRAALADGASNHWEALVEAIRARQERAACYLIDRGASPFPQDVSPNVGGAGRWVAPLTEAVENGCAEVVSRLVDAGADIHFRLEEALARAAFKGDESIVAALLAHGADASAGGTWRPLASAADSPLRVVRLLLRAGAPTEDPELLSHFLARAAEEGDEKLGAELLASGALPGVGFTRTEER